MEISINGGIARGRDGKYQMLTEINGGLATKWGTKSFHHLTTNSTIVLMCFGDFCRLLLYHPDGNGCYFNFSEIVSASASVM